MLKQWSRFGSGCYQYECAAGRVNILLRDVSYPCTRPGQAVGVALVGYPLALVAVAVLARLATVAAPGGSKWCGEQR